MAVDPEQSIYNALKLRGETLFFFEGGSVDLSKFKRIFVIGGGKAGGLMARAIELLLGKRVVSGCVNVLKGTEDSVALSHICLNGASHPIPSLEGVEGVRKMLDLTEKLEKDDLVVALISGGGSSLMPLPAEGITLDDLQKITGCVLRAGATINELNSVRKHLSAFKGGQLARHCSPAMVLSLILSDVIGDPLDTIASGPTAPDDTTFSDAYDVLKKYRLFDTAPACVKKRIMDGLEGKIPDNPKKGDPVFTRIFNVVIANNSLAARAAQRKSEELGYSSMILSTSMEGEAKLVGATLSGVAKEIQNNAHPLKPPASVVIGGETTVTVKGSGVGGRNQELALGAALKITGLSCVVAALGTDGIDGPTVAAGAIVDGATLGKAEANGMNPIEYLDDNDSYTFFNKLGDAIVTGPTGTNVNDLTLILLR